MTDRERLVVGLDIGGTKIRGALSGADRVVRSERVEPTEPGDAAAVVAQLVRLAHALAQDAGVPWSRVACVAAGAPGAFDPQTGHISLISNVPGMEGDEVRGALERALEVPVLFDNDVNLAALGEQSTGGFDDETFVFIAIGTGVGMGVVIDGRLHRGAHGSAGEVAYLPLTVPDGVGALPGELLEEHLCGPAIARRYAAVASVGDGATATGIAPAPAPIDVFARASAREPEALGVVEEQARLLAFAIESAAAFVDPARVVLGGAVGSSELLLERTRAWHTRMTHRQIPIHASAFGERAAVEGALAAALSATAPPSANGRPARPSLDSQMLREIREQPAAIAKTLESAASGVAELAELLRAPAHPDVLIVARGTSRNAAIYARHLLEEHAGIGVTLTSPRTVSALMSDAALRGRVVLGISQSGSVPEVVAALQRARESGATAVALTNNSGSALAHAASLVLATEAGVELAVPATKTFIAQLAIVALLAAQLGADEVDDGLPALAEVVARTIDDVRTDADAIAKLLAGRDSLASISEGVGLNVAVEVALKLKETAGIWAEGFAGVDLLHGPIAALGGRPALVWQPDAWPSADQLELEAVLADCADPLVVVGPGRTVATPQVARDLSPFPLVVAGQLIAERLARLTGRDPDAPPALRKVTAT